MVLFILRAPHYRLQAREGGSSRAREYRICRTQIKVHCLISPQRRHFREKQTCSEGSAGSIIHESVEKTSKKLLLHYQKREKQQKSYGQLD